MFATGYINDLILIRKQMSDLGLRPPIVTMIAGPAYQEFVDAGGPLAENVSSAAWWHPAVRYKGKDVFGSTEDFNKLFGAKVQGRGRLRRGLRRRGRRGPAARDRDGGLDRPDKVRDALAALDTETFFGRVKFGADRPDHIRSSRRCSRSRAASRS